VAAFRRRARFANIRAMGQRVASVEVAASAGFMAPLHAHGADEAVHVVEGSLTVYAGDETMQVGPGETFVVREGVPHSYRVDAPARSVFTTLTASASGYESFLRATGPVAPDGAWSTDEDAATVAALAAAADIDLFGPPGLLPPAGERAHAA
jgi:mannose-6-phosphate isomerase-like protein (cupin superfamily)